MENANKKDDFKSLFQDKKSQNFTVWVVGITISLLILFILVNQLLKIEQFGQLGDFFNGIAAPVLSLITIILLYNSFLVQKEELKTASDALKQSVEEMKNSAAIMERTEQNAKLERLESICFKLLDKYENSRDKIWPNRSTNQNIGDYIPGMTTKHLFITLKLKIADNNNQVDKKMIDQFLNSFIDKFKEQNYYKEIQSLVYKFLAIYNCILNSKITPEELKYLRFAINNHLTKEEMFFVKLFINQLDDLSNLRTELENFEINSTSEAIYEQHIKDEVNKLKHV